MLKNITLVLTTHSTATFKLHHITLYTPRQQMYHFEKEKNAQIHLNRILSVSFFPQSVSSTHSVLLEKFTNFYTLFRELFRYNAN